MASVARKVLHHSLRCPRIIPSTSSVLPASTSLVRYSSSNVPQTSNHDKGIEEVDAEGVFPNLMTPDPLMDLHQSEVFPATAKYPYESKVIIRNDPSMFKAYQNVLKEKYNVTQAELDKQVMGRDTIDSSRFLPIDSKTRQQMHQYTMINRRVTRQTGKGKIHRVGYFIVVGNGDGLVGYGQAKHDESSVALEKANFQAYRSMDHVERFEGRTVWTEMEDKMGATRIILRPRPVGFGLRCSPTMHPIFRAAGIKDISAKVWGSRNPMTVMKLLFRMLYAGNAPLGMGDGVGGGGRKLEKGIGMRGKDEIQRERGRKLLNVWRA
ncbi:hypothetical protein QCA50_006346 [Cerrena zonata]|uniref:S5 DRBM domain-containing protein n=1 Tax=Cerrena zonata TaxID=2478898 RepID=A0AAW0GB65_9APHY